MTHAHLIIGILILLACVVAGLIWLSYRKYDFVLTEKEIQSKIDAKLPFTTESGVTISKAVLDLTHDKIGIALEAEATKLGTKMAVCAKASGVLRYDGKEGSFYFHPESLELTDLKTDGDSVSSKLGALFDEWIKSPALVEQKDNLVAAGSKAVNYLLHKAAELMLGSTPLFTLPNDLKGNTVRLCLQSVVVQNRTVTAHVTFWQVARKMGDSIVKTVGEILLFLLLGLLVSLFIWL
jgi:hypothetical protein